MGVGEVCLIVFIILKCVGVLGLYTLIIIVKIIISFKRGY